MMDSKPFEVILWGASGFTGKLLCEYLAKIPGLKWAAGGRSKSKVERVLHAINVDVPVLTADSHDLESLVRMVVQAKLVMSTVGPFTIHGSKLVQACAENGIHYIDLPGETAWMKTMIEQHGATAVSTRSLLVFAAAFDSVPSDLCVLLAVARLKATAPPESSVGEVVGSVVAYGTISGGSLASVLASIEGPEEARAVARDPYCISPVHGSHEPAVEFSTSWEYKGQGHWGSFWVMAQTNGGIVRRTWGLFENADLRLGLGRYGPEFSYKEVLSRPGPPLSGHHFFATVFGVCGRCMGRSRSVGFEMVGTEIRRRPNTGSNAKQLLQYHDDCNNRR